jgi:hypothetical protein
VSFYGYAEVNTQATSPVARIKQHKAWFVGNADITEGDLIQDKADNKYYLVMSLKKEVTGSEVAYIDGTLYYANATCSIERFAPVSVNAFGREVSAEPSVIAEGVYIMVNSMSMDVDEQRDQHIAEEKIKVVMQSKYGAKINDRLVSSNGDVYKVATVDRTQLENLVVLYVAQDIR